MAELGLIANTRLLIGFNGYIKFERVLFNEFYARRFEFFGFLSALSLGYGI